MHVSQGMIAHVWTGAAACLHIHYLPVLIWSRLASFTLHGISHGSPLCPILGALEHNTFCVHVFFQFKEFKTLRDPQFCPPAQVAVICHILRKLLQVPVHDVKAFRVFESANLARSVREPNLLKSCLFFL